MGKDRKKPSAWNVFLCADLTALAIYMAGNCLLALLVVKGVVPEQAVFPLVAVCCLLASLAAALIAVRNTSFGKLPAALASAGVFAVTLVIIGMCVWHEISWPGRGGVLLLCVLAGGALAALSGGRKRRGGKRMRKK